VAATNNLKLDKQHTFTVNLFSGTVAFIFALFQCSDPHPDPPYVSGLLDLDPSCTKQNN
jgi:hypothetical protein